MEVGNSYFKPIPNQFYSIGANSYEDIKVIATEKAASAKETAGMLSNAAYSKAREAKHAALDWITSMTSN